MRFKKYILGMLIISLILVIGCSKNVFLDEQNGKLLNYNFKISRFSNIEKTLEKQRYSYSTNIDKKYVAVITYKSKKATIKQYAVSRDELLDVTVPIGSSFVISLPANRTIAYTWNIKNNIDNKIINFENRSWIRIPMPKAFRGMEGSNYDRQNFYFKPLKSGSEKLVMRYEHKNEERDEFFEITINIKIVE